MAGSKKNNVTTPTVSKEKKKRSPRVNQTDIPAYTLEDALKVPEAIAENYASKPSDPFKVAKAMNLAPNSTQFKMLTGAAIAYGLTEGGAHADKISITTLAKRILTPSNDKDGLLSRRVAFLKPRVINDFLMAYNKSSLPPKESIAHEELISLGIPDNRAPDTFRMIIQGAEALGFISEIKGKKYVNLDEFEAQEITVEEESPSEDTPVNIHKDASDLDDSQTLSSPVALPWKKDDGRKRRVFITHGKKRDFLDLIKKMLSFGELEPVVAVEMQSVSEPIPDKVMNEMRSCGAAIIHVDAEQRLIDQQANEHIILNPNVLIEIGAAMALYGRRFILLVREGVKLPSNLQGLYEVRYPGDTLDGDTTIKLLEAINQMKMIDLAS